jgi:hypothetical protein
VPAHAVHEHAFVQYCDAPLQLSGWHCTLVVGLQLLSPPHHAQAGLASQAVLVNPSQLDTHWQLLSHSLLGPQLLPTFFPSHAASAPHPAEQTLLQLPTEQENGLQLMVPVHCQNLLQLPEPSHLYCFFPLLHESLHSYPPVEHAVFGSHTPAPVHVVSAAQFSV